MRPDIVEYCQQFASACAQKFQGDRLTVVAIDEIPKFDGDPVEVQALAERLIAAALPGLGTTIVEIDNERRLEAILIPRAERPLQKVTLGDIQYCEFVAQECERGYFKTPRQYEFEIQVPSYQLQGKSKDILEYAIAAVTKRIDPNEVSVAAHFERAPDRMKVVIRDR
ncbi:hypothetical protein R2537_007119 [Pseudomonas aeruginosa]|nr:hypothetical protein [Pseudomonas aeruginosa]